MNKITIFQGDVMDRLREMPDESVHCVVTSPPYWGLRNYDVDGQIGLELTLEEYVQKMVEVFREVRRVLRRDGVCFVNLGDSYAGSWGNYGARQGKQREQKEERWERPGYERENYTTLPPTVHGTGLKPKDLCGVPWRVVLALQADGWWLRSDIIWAKPNPLPESVTDRPTKAHEYVFLLTKAEKYFWDQEGVREGVTGNAHSKGNKLSPPREDAGIGHKDWCATTSEIVTSRNLRTVWTIPTESFPAAHFATFPQALVERCIKAGTSEKGCCPECGKPWKRVVEKRPATSKECPKEQAAHEARGGTGRHTGTVGKSGGGRVDGNTTTLGWQPSCTCDIRNYPTNPCTVLDPFLGSGTTALVAAKMGRDAVGIELKLEYVEMAKTRIKQSMGMMIDLQCP